MSFSLSLSLPRLIKTNAASQVQVRVFATPCSGHRRHSPICLESHFGTVIRSMMSEAPPSARTAIIAHVVHLVNRQYYQMTQDYFELGFMDRSVDTAPIAPALAAFFDDALDLSVGELNLKAIVDGLGSVLFAYPFSVPCASARRARRLSPVLAQCAVGLCHLRPSFTDISSPQRLLHTRHASVACRGAPRPGASCLHARCCTRTRRRSIGACEHASMRADTTGGVSTYADRTTRSSCGARSAQR